MSLRNRIHLRRAGLTRSERRKIVDNVIIGGSQSPSLDLLQILQWRHTLFVVVWMKLKGGCFHFSSPQERVHGVEIHVLAVLTTGTQRTPEHLPGLTWEGTDMDFPFVSWIFVTVDPLTQGAPPNLPFRRAITTFFPGQSATGKCPFLCTRLKMKT